MQNTFALESHSLLFSNDYGGMTFIQNSYYGPIASVRLMDHELYNDLAIVNVKIFVFTVLDDAAVPLRKLIESSASYWTIVFTKWGTETATRDSLYFGGKKTLSEDGSDDVEYLILSTIKV